MKKIYLDHNATTPVLPEVFEAMRPYFMEEFGNASSIHGYGRVARVVIEESRQKIAAILQCAPDEIVFTSGGTESDNLAIKGGAWAKKDSGKHIITSAIEHHAVLESCRYLKKTGFEVTYLKPDRLGRIASETLKQAIRSDTILISIMHANNETGVIQDIPSMSKIALESGIAFHTDAVQSTGKIPYSIPELGIEMLSISAHKFYGPKGVGLLYIKKKTKIMPLNHGGSHENNKRAGTENVPGIVGLAKALEVAQRDLLDETNRLAKIKSIFVDGVKKRIRDIEIIGDQQNCIPNTVCISFKGIEGESIVLSLDLKGIAVSSGSACSSGSVNASHVILAMGIPPEQAHGIIRFSFGRTNSESDIVYILDVLEQEIARIRSISPLYGKA
jgi:cysteine desulfurase